jgi:D-glycero-D-manno-heptose 1,7-bisphosphate phosphatase
MKAVILDRDGVINQDSPDFIKTADEWLPITGSLEAIAKLKSHGFLVFVASNQSGIGRGLVSPENSEAIFQKMQGELAKLGATLDGVVFCPHLPDAGCDCRKPKAGLFFQIRDQYKIDLSECYAVGDSLRDLEAAITAGAKPILVKTGNGIKTERVLLEKNLHLPVYDDLAAFVQDVT